MTRTRSGAGIVSALLVAAAVLFAGRIAMADVAKAKAHYERGMSLYQLGEYRRALEEFKEAHIEKTDPAFLYNIAQCYRQLGDVDEALTFYRRYLSLGPPGPLHDDVERRVTELELSRSPAPTSSPSRSQVVPVVVPPAPKNDAEVHMSAPAPPTTPPAPRTPLPRWLPWTAAGTTVALGIAAIATGVSASNHFDSLQSSCGQTSSGCTNDQIDSVKTRARTANVFWILTGAAAVATGATFYVNTHEAGIDGVWSF